MGFMTHWYLAAALHPYDTLWNAAGFLGQAIFGVRFLIQWLRSEQEGHSVIPIAFWYCSLAGGLISFSYVIHQQAWPLIIGLSYLAGSSSATVLAARCSAVMMKACTSGPVRLNSISSVMNSVLVVRLFMVVLSGWLLRLIACGSLLPGVGAAS